MLIHNKCSAQVCGRHQSHELSQNDQGESYFALSYQTSSIAYTQQNVMNISIKFTS